MRLMMSVLACAVLALACGAPAGEEDVMTTEMGEMMGDAPAARPAGGDGSPEGMVLAELNETCEDNWCYGEFEYEFLALECGKTTCELFFRAEGAGEEFEDSVVFDYDEPLVEDGYLEAGNWERVSDAITDWEMAREGG